MAFNYSIPIFFARFGHSLGNALNLRVMYRDPKVVYEGYISGYQYHSGTKLEHLFSKGTEFSLKHEPENPFDDHAVALYYNNARIGFIPSDTSTDIADRLQKGEKLKARISELDFRTEPWEHVSVEVLLEDVN